MNGGFFLKRINISASQMNKGDNNGVGNRLVWFGSMTSLGKGCNRHYILWLPHRKCIVKIYTDCKFNIVPGI